MRTKTLTLVLALGTIVLSSCSMFKGTSETQPNTFTSTGAPTKAAGPLEEISRLAPNWPESSQQALRGMLERYGQPTEQTASTLVWTNIAPFKRIVIYREAVSHKFPILHEDVIEHVVNYRVPVEKAAELAKFDGSLSFNRTAGELAVRSDKEAMNFLSLNLASDIIQGKRDASSARIEYGKRTVDLLNGNRTAQTENLQFIAQNNTGDADQSAKINWVQAEEARPTKRQPTTGNAVKQAQEEEMAE